LSYTLAMLVRIGLSVLALFAAFVVLLTTAYSFGLGQTVQNFVMLLDAVLLLVWLYFIWRGKNVVALLGIAATFLTGVFVIPFLAR
jgi:hypothetical protein